MEAEKSHIMVIMQELLDGKASTAIDSKASNRNQYYLAIKKQGIKLIEEWVANFNNTGRHKVRSLDPTPENVERAKLYYKSLGGKIK